MHFSHESWAGPYVTFHHFARNESRHKTRDMGVSEKDVHYDVAGSIRGKKVTDQLIYKEESVKLSALFLAAHS